MQNKMNMSLRMSDQSTILDFSMTDRGASPNKKASTVQDRIDALRKQRASKKPVDESARKKERSDIQIHDQSTMVSSYFAMQKENSETSSQRFLKFY